MNIYLKLIMMIYLFLHQLLKFIIIKSIIICIMISLNEFIRRAYADWLMK